jgi:hypothetical protein
VVPAHLNSRHQESSLFIVPTGYKSRSHARYFMNRLQLASDTIKNQGCYHKLFFKDVTINHFSTNDDQSLKKHKSKDCQLVDIDVLPTAPHACLHRSAHLAEEKIPQHASKPPKKISPRVPSCLISSTAQKSFQGLHALGLAVHRSASCSQLPHSAPPLHLAPTVPSPCPSPHPANL